MKGLDYLGKGRTWSSPVGGEKAVSSSKGYNTCFYMSRFLLSGCLSVVLSSLLFQILQITCVVLRKKMRSYPRNDASYFWNLIRWISVNFHWLNTSAINFYSLLAEFPKKKRETLQFFILQSLRLHDLGTRYPVIRDACKDVESRPVAALNSPLDLQSISTRGIADAAEFTFHGTL